MHFGCFLCEGLKTTISKAKEEKNHPLEKEQKLFHPNGLKKRLIQSQI